MGKPVMKRGLGGSRNIRACVVVSASSCESWEKRGSQEEKKESSLPKRMYEHAMVEPTTTSRMAMVTDE